MCNQESRCCSHICYSDRLPRGQTRKLASLFETMSDAASVEMLREMDHLKRRGKSVPPNIINKTYQRESEINVRRLFQGSFCLLLFRSSIPFILSFLFSNSKESTVSDDLTLQQRSIVTASSERHGTHLGTTVPCKRNASKEQFPRDKRIETCSVRSIVDRLDFISLVSLLYKFFYFCIDILDLNQQRPRVYVKIHLEQFKLIQHHE